MHALTIMLYFMHKNELQKCEMLICFFFMHLNITNRNDFAQRVENLSMFVVTTFVLLTAAAFFNAFVNIEKSNFRESLKLKKLENGFFSFL